MANSEASTTVSSALPLPPSNYYSLYTDENIRRGRVLRPPNPIMDSYTMFGTLYQNDDSIIRPLESQGIRRLYPQNCDRRRELRKLNHSLLVNFLDLLDLLAQYPESSRRAEKVEDLNLLFIHIHHLLNEFRPHQARETLRVMMELQKRQRLETAARFHKHLDKVMEILDQALQMLPDNEELESKLLIPLECVDNMSVTSADDTKVDACSTLDRMMCEIVDSM